MNKKALLLGAGLTLQALAGDAQSVSYKLITADPGNYKRTTLYLDLFNVDTYLNPCLGSGLKLETVLANRLMPWVQMRYSWADMATHHVVSGYPTNEGGQKKQLVIDAGAALFLLNSNKSKRVKVVLSSYSSGRYTHTKYLMVPGIVRRMFGVEGGLYYNRKALEFEEESHALYHYKSMDGKTDMPIPGVGGSTVGQPSGEAYNPLSMTNVASVYGGIHYRKIVYTEIRTDNYGIKGNRSVMDYYADIMLAPVIPIANVIDTKGQEWELVPQPGAINHLGWKAGFSYHGAKRVGGFYGLEVGKRPAPALGTGFMENGGFVALSLGLSIGFDKQFKTSIGAPKAKQTSNSEAK